VINIVGVCLIDSLHLLISECNGLVLVNVLALALLLVKVADPGLLIWGEGHEVWTEKSGDPFFFCSHAFRYCNVC